MSGRRHLWRDWRFLTDDDLLGWGPVCIQPTARVFTDALGREHYPVRVTRGAHAAGATPHAPKSREINRASIGQNREGVKHG